ncbi:MAG: zinc ribbon domain-containing protein [Eubacteriaceae bacterium]|nr:zinc ribbon domain-containing protein [Eubacteriaceae bacterium]
MSNYNDNNSAYCRSCGSRIERGHRFCIRCGAPVPEAPRAQPRARARVDICPKCGTRKVQNAKFCHSCGLSFDEPKQVDNQEFCMNCGTVKIKGAAFCTKCGSKFEAPKPDPVCSVCGERIRRGAKFCIKCGATYGDGNEAGQAKQPEVTCPNCGLAKMTYSDACPRCGTAYEDGNNFKALEEEKKPFAELKLAERVCLNCGHAIQDSEALFCTRCGSAVSPMPDTPETASLSTMIDDIQKAADAELGQGSEPQSALYFGDESVTIEKSYDIASGTDEITVSNPLQYQDIYPEPEAADAAVQSPEPESLGDEPQGDISLPTLSIDIGDDIEAESELPPAGAANEPDSPKAQDAPIITAEDIVASAINLKLDEKLGAALYENEAGAPNDGQVEIITPDEGGAQEQDLSIAEELGRAIDAQMPGLADETGSAADELAAALADALEADREIAEPSGADGQQEGLSALGGIPSSIELKLGGEIGQEPDGLADDAPDSPIPAQISADAPLIVEPELNFDSEDALSSLEDFETPQPLTLDERESEPEQTVFLSPGPDSQDNEEWIDTTAAASDSSDLTVDPITEWIDAKEYTECDMQPSLELDDDGISPIKAFLTLDEDAPDHMEYLENSDITLENSALNESFLDFSEDEDEDDGDAGASEFTDAIILPGPEAYADFDDEDDGEGEAPESLMQDEAELCPHCGAARKPGPKVNFCNKCGYRF